MPFRRFQEIMQQLLGEWISSRLTDREFSRANRRFTALRDFGSQEESSDTVNAGGSWHGMETVSVGIGDTTQPDGAKAEPLWRDVACNLGQPRSTSIRLENFATRRMRWMCPRNGGDERLDYRWNPPLHGAIRTSATEHRSSAGLRPAFRCFCAVSNQFFQSAGSGPACRTHDPAQGRDGISSGFVGRSIRRCRRKNPIDGPQTVCPISHFARNHE